MSARPTTQKARVLRALERAGGRGITQVDFLGPVTIDGGGPVLRLTSRIVDLRADGHEIEVRGRRAKCVVYVLRPEPVSVLAAAARMDGPPLLFEPPAPAPRSAIIGDFGDER